MIQMMKTWLMGSMTKMYNMKIKAQPDEFGFVYGIATDGEGNAIRVDIMPPKKAWHGGTMLQGFCPHESDWVVYLDGQEVCRVQEAVRSRRPRCGTLNRQDGFSKIGRPLPV